MRNVSTFASASATRARRSATSGLSDSAAGARVLALGLALDVDIGAAMTLAARAARSGSRDREFDLQHARLGRRENRQPVEIGVEHALFGREPRRIAGDAERDADAGQQAGTTGQRIEFGIALELERLQRTAREIARGGGAVSGSARPPHPAPAASDALALVGARGISSPDSPAARAPRPCSAACGVDVDQRANEGARASAPITRAPTRDSAAAICAQVDLACEPPPLAQIAGAASSAPQSAPIDTKIMVSVRLIAPINLC